MTFGSGEVTAGGREVNFATTKRGSFVVTNKYRKTISAFTFVELLVHVTPMYMYK